MLIYLSFKKPRNKYSPIEALLPCIPKYSQAKTDIGKKINKYKIFSFKAENNFYRGKFEKWHDIEY